jgi:phosphoribosylformylglycinamidine (FGAM) synthase-like enzyme
VPDVRTVPNRWREGDVVLVAGAPKLTLAWSEYQALYGEPGGARPDIDLRAERALVELLWRAAPDLSLAHDTSAGGLAVALAEAALWSGVGAEVELPDDLPAWFGEGGGQAVIACTRTIATGLIENDSESHSRGVTVRELGVVGGDHLLEIPLGELERAWTGS